MSTDVIHFDEQYYIVSEKDRPGIPPRVLKADDSFAVFDQHGDMHALETGEHGLYHDGTRHLSRFELLLGGLRPLLLSSTISDDNAIFTADATNLDVRRGENIVLPRGELHLFRARVLAAGRCLERLRVSNYAQHTVAVQLSVRIDADFADLFEVRGAVRDRRGERQPDGVDAEYVLAYRGLDRVERRTRITSSRGPDHVAPGVIGFDLRLEPRGWTEIELSVDCESNGAARQTVSFDGVLATTRDRLAAGAEQGCRVSSSNEAFNRWVRRSLADLQMMITETPHGLYPYAGIPWFSTPFGRDGIITAIQLLWSDPAVARGVLSFLAATQATEYDDASDAQPGKILHEMRRGEMAALGEIPFARYYGTADATPLFVMLAHAYFDRTADEALIDTIWPNILAALEWMQSAGDPDHDGFIEYARRSDTGLVQQGWKDSHDSVFHENGALADPPIALCEVQGYAYAAWQGAAHLALARGDARRAAEWQLNADRLRDRFEAAFWCEDLDTYALALDGRKRPCRVRTSNPGHCLFTGIAVPAHAQRACTTLLSDASFAGWGVRTLAAGERRYNPMSYHNGSIWPHDTAIAAAGMSRYGFTDAAARITSALFDLSQMVDLHRLPELVCGFHRRRGEYPTLYPVACAPQAWAAGTVYLLIQACLGLRLDAPARRIVFSMATLPDGVEWLELRNLKLRDASLDVRLERHAHSVGVRVLRREGDFEIVTVK